MLISMGLNRPEPMEHHHHSLCDASLFIVTGHELMIKSVIILTIQQLAKAKIK